MSNQTEEPVSTGWSTLSGGTTAPVQSNSTLVVPPTFAMDIIEANDLTSRSNYIYTVFLSLGFLSACFLLYSFIQTYRAQRRVAWLDCLLWAFCGSQLLLLLLSLSSVAHRPDYLVTARWGCAALSFVVNLVSLCGMLILVLMAYVLTFDPPSDALRRRCGACVALVAVMSITSSLLLAGLRGPSHSLGEEESCSIDPVQAGLSYAAAKLCMTFLIPYMVLIGLLIGGCVRQWRTSGRFLSGLEEGPVFLAVAVVTFACQLFYGVVLVRGAALGQSDHLERAFLSVGEFVLFSGSCLSLVLVLLVHRPCRESLRAASRQLAECCQELGSMRSPRHFTPPHIEITDTQPDG